MAYALKGFNQQGFGADYTTPRQALSNQMEEEKKKKPWWTSLISEIGGTGGALGGAAAGVVGQAQTARSVRIAGAVHADDALDALLGRGVTHQAARTVGVGVANALVRNRGGVADRRRDRAWRQEYKEDLASPHKPQQYDLHFHPN